MSKILKKKKGEKNPSSQSAHGRADLDVSELSVPLLDATETITSSQRPPSMSDDANSTPKASTENDEKSEETKCEDGGGKQTDQNSIKFDHPIKDDGSQITTKKISGSNCRAQSFGAPSKDDETSNCSNMEKKQTKMHNKTEHCDGITSSPLDSETDVSSEKDTKNDGSSEIYEDRIGDDLDVKIKSSKCDDAPLNHVLDGTLQSDTESIYCDCKSEVSLDSVQGTSGTNPTCDLLPGDSEIAQTNDADADAPDLFKPRKSLSGSSICTFALSTQSTMTDFCRICHCEGDAELGPLIAPCFCRGSLRYVHQACLQQWIKSSDSKNCELCGYHFVMDSKLKPFHKWKKLSMSTTERRKIMCSVMFHIIAITCVIWSLYVLIERTASEIKDGKLEWPFWTKLVVVAIGFTGGLVFMYVQCKVYVQLWRRLKAFNRVIYVKNNTPVVLAATSPDDDTVMDIQSVDSRTEYPSGESCSEARHNEGVVTVEMNCQAN